METELLSLLCQKQGPPKAIAFKVRFKTQLCSCLRPGQSPTDVWVGKAEVTDGVIKSNDSLTSFLEALSVYNLGVSVIGHGLASPPGILSSLCKVLFLSVSFRRILQHSEIIVFLLISQFLITHQKSTLF